MCSTKVARAITRAEHVELLWVSCEARRSSKRRHRSAVSTSTVVWMHGFEPSCCCQVSRGTDVWQQRHRSEYLVREARLWMHRCEVSRVMGAWHQRHGLS